MAENLQILQMKMAAALRRLGTHFLGKQARLLIETQNDDGGWPGREGASDLYYTAFGARASNLLGGGNDTLWDGVHAFLRNAPVPRSIADACSFAEARALSGQRDGIREMLDGERTEAIIDTVEGFRCGAAYRHEGQDAGSVYQTFLAWRTYESLGNSMPALGAALDWVEGRLRDDGGFAESEGAAASGVNPTVAGYHFLSAQRSLCVCVGEGVRDFLASMQRADGGFAAHRDAPESDLLSTFTALLTLTGLSGLSSVNLTKAARFAKSLAHPDGGFLGSPSDDGVDVEYTFYGLGCLGLLASAAGAVSNRAT